MNEDEFTRSVLRKAVIAVFLQDKSQLEEKLYAKRIKERYAMLAIGIVTPFGIIMGNAVYDQDLVKFTEIQYNFRDKDTIIDLQELEDESKRTR